MAISIKNWNLNLILLSSWCFTKISYDLLLSGCQADGNAWKSSTTATTNEQISRALVATGTSSTHLVWQNINGNWSDRFMVIYVSLLAGESWNNPHMFFDFPPSSFNPRLERPRDDMKSARAHFNNWRTSLRFKCSSIFLLY